MDQRHKTLLIIILIAIVVWWLLGWLFKGKSEGFGPDTYEFVPEGSDRYGLRGDLLRRRPIDDYYIVPHRQMRLNSSSGLMYVSNRSPSQEGVKNCRKVQCPTNTNEYDDMDTCWMCGNECQEPIEIKSIWPHT